jgi:diguanylate cyclase (GGDEF)-like protein/PAS domain S-box-containing protein
MNTQQYSVNDIIDNIYYGLYLVDKLGHITYWNRAAENISGLTVHDLIGHPYSRYILLQNSTGKNSSFNACPLTLTIADGKPRESEGYLHHKEGSKIPISVRISALIDTEGNSIGGIVLFTDISTQVANELRLKELEKMAFLDSLTQLANRNYIKRELESRFAEINRFNLPFGILFIDIDNFKIFNDTYGHNVGDIVLRFVANTFMTNARPFDLYGRWGGEEFIGIIRNINGKDLESLGKRMCSLIAESYILHDQKKLKITVSIGGTLGIKNDTIEEIIKRADKALYASKIDGKNRVTMEPAA